VAFASAADDRACHSRHATVQYGEQQFIDGSRASLLRRAVVLASGQYLKPRDVAAELDVTLRTVYSWIATGKLASVRLSPRARRIPQKDLDRFLAIRREGGSGA
jgi:excisionase family DNA binding protein